MPPQQTIRPTPFQATVLSVPEDHFLFLGGGRGGGKSFALQFLILRHCDQYRARARVLVTRRRLKSLLQFAEELRGLLRSAYGSGVSYNQNDNVFRLPNGASGRADALREQRRPTGHRAGHDLLADRGR